MDRPTPRPTRATLACALFLLSPAAAAAQQPAAPPPGTQAALRRANPQMRRVLEQLQALGAKPIEQLSVQQARSQPTPADAVKAVLRQDKKDPAALMAAIPVTTSDATYPTAGGTQPVRIYTPRSGTRPLPVIVYYHGGGWVIADIETYESSAMALAAKTGAIVASVEYRKAPEHPVPAPHQDAFAAYRWVHANAAQLGGDPERIALAGESAGGNLAMTTAIMARDSGGPAPAHILAVYPIAGTDLNTPSYQTNAQAMPLSKAGMQWFVAQAVKRPADKKSPLLNLYAGASLRGLPGVTIVNAEIDPLLSDGERLEQALSKARVPVERRVYQGVTHEFFGMDAVVDEAAKAQQYAAGRLKAALSRRASAAATSDER